MILEAQFSDAARSRSLREVWLEAARLVLLAFQAFQSITCCALNRPPRRRLPRGAGSACRRVFHPCRVERRAPASVVVLSQLQIEALTVHPDGDVADAGPGVEPGREAPTARGRRRASSTRRIRLLPAEAGRVGQSRSAGRFALGRVLQDVRPGTTSRNVHPSGVEH